MADPVRVKICGLTGPQSVADAVAAGAQYLGFNFYPPSPRCLTCSVARDLVASVPAGVARVGLVVDADDDMLAALLAEVPLDMLQLHGGESPARVAEVRARFGLPVIKAVGVATAADLTALDAHADVADQILVDAKPPRGAALPGGNGLAFDWRLIADRRWSGPWLLAGGLRPENVAAPIRPPGPPRFQGPGGGHPPPGGTPRAPMAAFMQAAGVGGG
ncbi:MAG: phosphoribosylanthranilate isomerase [Rhodobacteraceae bacterium]|nr:phosphoribosylanthranilate isomerase [Paracoccaceae bacterium]